MPNYIQSTSPDGRVLRRVSSIILNSPTTPGRKGVAKVFIQSKSHSTQTAGKLDLDMEIVPDSEEERRYTEKNGKGRGLVDLDVIEISSDEEHRDIVGGYEASSLDDPFVSKVSDTGPINDAEAIKAGNVNKLLDRDWAPRTPHTISKLRRTYRSRMIIQSSSSEGSDDEHDKNVIELSDSSPERSPKPGSRIAAKPIAAAPPRTLAHCSEEEDSCSDDGAILTLNEPKSARKPIRINLGYPRGTTAAVLDLTLSGTPSRPKSLREVLGTPCTPHSESSPTKAKQAPRTGKKAQAATEQARRAAYAQVLFTELNRVVFGDGLPHDTKLNWNKRLLTTAGRAKWHRDGVQTAEIELAEKILDCEERIRNTLSHEMCHLATWIVNANPKEGHGKLWKEWAAKVMRKRPEITITTRHDYEISHPFEWECEKCTKIYGRFSKSIRPNECVCGACKEGKLIPLFSDSKKTPKLPKTSRNASIKAKDSPRSVPRPHIVHCGDDEIEIDDARPVHRGPDHHPIYTVHTSNSESDSDIKVLTTAMGSVVLSASDS